MKTATKEAQYNEAKIKEYIEKYDKMVKNSIMELYRQQTSDEQSSETTLYRNNRGFNGVDAEFGSSLARQIQQGRDMSPKQLAAGRKMLLKYVGQLTKLANGEM